MNSIDTLHPSLENLCSKWGFRKLWHVCPHHKGTTGASKLIHLTIVLDKLPMNRLEFSMEAFGILRIRFKNSEGTRSVGAYHKIVREATCAARHGLGQPAKDFVFQQHPDSVVRLFQKP